MNSVSTWFGSFGFPMGSGVTGCLTAPLELQILLINVLRLVFSTWNWRRLKWDQQLEKIWKLSVSQPDDLNVKDVEWIKIILSRIVQVRFIVDRVSLFAYMANIYTILTQNWKNLLVPWMVLSLINDIILEFAVVLITLLLWYQGRVTTPLLMAFIAEKMIWSIFLIYNWRATTKLYTQLQRLEKFREFTVIAQKRLASIVHVSERVRYPPDYEYREDIGINKRGKYGSLLNLYELSAESEFNRLNLDLRTSKSLTTFVNNENHYDTTDDTNDYDSIANDLSVAEKSMKMLNVTAEDVMDARARIQERSYWDEDDEKLVETSEATSVEKCEEHTDSEQENKQITMDSSEIQFIDHSSRQKEETAECALIEKRSEKNEDETDLADEKVETVTNMEEKQSIPLTTNGDTSSDKVQESIESQKSDVTPEKEKTDEITKSVNNVQYPLDVSTSLNDESSYSFFLAKQVDPMYYTSFTSDEQEQIDKANIKPSQLIRSSDSDTDGKFVSSCHCFANIDSKEITRDNIQNVQLTDFDVEHENERKVECLNPDNIVQSDKPNICDSMLNCPKDPLEKRISYKSQRFSKRSSSIAWGTMSLAQLAHVSGYEKEFSIVNKSSTFRETNVQNNPCKESIESLNLKRFQQMHCRQSYKKKNHTESIENREAIELKALKAYNKFTLWEDKKQLEMRRKHKLKFSKACNSPVTSTNPITYSDGSIEEVRNVTIYNESILHDKRDMDSLETLLKCNEVVDNPPSSSDRFTKINDNNVVIRISETHKNTDNSDNLNDLNAKNSFTLSSSDNIRDNEWTFNSCGIQLTDNSLQQQKGKEKGKRRGQRNITNNNIINDTLDIMRNTHFHNNINDLICRLNNEIDAIVPNSLFDLKCITDKRYNSKKSHFLKLNRDYMLAQMSGSCDLCIMVIEKEDFKESPSTIMEDSTTIESRRSTHSDSYSMRNIKLDKNHRTEHAIDNNFFMQFLMNISRIFNSGIVSTEHTNNSPEIPAKHKNTSDSTSDNDSIKDKINSDSRKNTYETSFNLTEDINDETIDGESLTVESNEISEDDMLNNVTNSNDINRLISHEITMQNHNSMQVCCIEENLVKTRDTKNSLKNLRRTDMTSCVNSSDNSSNEKYEINILNCEDERCVRINDLSSCKFDDCDKLKSDKQTFRSLTQFSDMLENTAVKSRRLDSGRIESDRAVCDANNSEIEHLKNIATQNNKIGKEDSDRDIYVKANEFSTGQDFFTRYSSDSFDSMYEKDISVETAVSLGDGSLMEEFSDDKVRTFSDATYSTQFQ